MKINLGSGYHQLEGYLSIDNDPKTNPDYIVNLETDKLPFEDNSIDEVLAHEILEHIGTGFFHLMQEIYRICKHGAILDIKAPHHFHDSMFVDPTHVRFITVEGMRLFSQKQNKEHIEKYRSSSGIGIRINVDFEVIEYNYEYDPLYHNMMENYNKRKEINQTSPEEDFMYMRLFREATNVAESVLIKMKVVKE